MESISFTSSLHSQEDGAVVVPVPPHVLSQIPRVAGQTVWIRMGKRRSNKQNDFFYALARARLLHNSLAGTKTAVEQEKRDLCERFGIFQDDAPLSRAQYTTVEFDEFLKRIKVDCIENGVDITREVTQYA